MQQTFFKIKFLVLLFALMLVGNIGFSQNNTPNQNYIITKRMLSVEEGLPSRVVFDAIQDKEGFMWFATANGLCRYDGNSFKIYNTKNSPLISNTITGLAIDAKNHLFVQTNANSGSIYQEDKLQAIDLNTYQFINLNQALPNLPFKTDRFNSIFHDASGSIYFLTDDRTKLWQYSKNATFKLRADFYATLNVKIPFSSEIKSANDCIFIKNFDKKQNYYIYPDTILLTDNKNLIPISITEKKEFILQNKITNIFLSMDASGKQNKIDISIGLDKEKSSKLIPYGFDDQSILFKSEQNTYYLQIDNQTIEIYNLNDRMMLTDFGVSNYIKDNKDNYWFCSEKGVYQVNIRQHQFDHVFSNNRINEMINNATRSIYVDQNKLGEKRIFAMVNYGLMKKEKEEKSIQNAQGTVLMKKEDWMYIAGGSFLKYNLNNGKYEKPFSFLNIGEVWSIANFSDSLFLIGGSSNIVAMNLKSGISTYINYADKKTPPPINVYRIIQTKFKGWIAVAENGIYFINNDCTIYDYYRQDQQQTEKRLPFTGIFDFYEDKSGVAWLAMNGEGLIRWNWNAKNPMASENIMKFTIENGLPDNMLYRIEEDNNNNLWISSYNGLVKFNKKNYSTKIFRKKDGLANTEFNRISSFKDDQGWMYFGGQNGIDAFDPAHLKFETKENVMPFKLVDLSLFSSSKNSNIDLTDALIKKKEILMKPDDINLSISFSLLDFQDRQHRYAYKIDGLDKDWNYINENRIFISRLPFGKSTIRIKAQLESGSWNAEEIIIPVMVLKPFYFQNWFIIAFIIFISGIIYTVFLLRARKFKLDKIKLEQKVQQRTESLNTALNQKEVLLTEIHHRVKNNLQVINGLLELRKTTIEDEKGMAAFNESQSGIMNIALIHELLYQSENVGQLEFNFILNNIISNVAQLFGKQDKKIIFEVEPNDFMFNMDTTVTLGLITNELLTNAFKYLTADTGKKVNIKIIKEQETYSFIFHDNGPGLKSDIDFDNASSIGFSMMRSLAMQLHGSIGYEYVQGSKFTVWFREKGSRGV